MFTLYFSYNGTCHLEVFGCLDTKLNQFRFLVIIDFRFYPSEAQKICVATLISAGEGKSGIGQRTKSIS